RPCPLPSALRPSPGAHAPTQRRLAPKADRPKPSAALGAHLAQELARVVHAPVLPDFEVHVGAGGAAGRAGPGDLLAHAHQVADLHRVARVVRIAGDVAIAVVHFDHVAVAAAHAGIADHAVGHGQDRIAGVGIEIDALVELAAAAERVGAAAVTRGDVAAGDRRARGHRVALQFLVEQQRLEHRQLPSGVAELRIDLVEAADQLTRWHVLAGFGAAQAHRPVEIELAVAELGDAREAVAQRIEAVGLRL